VVKTERFIYQSIYNTLRMSLVDKLKASRIKSIGKSALEIALGGLIAYNVVASDVDTNYRVRPSYASAEIKTENGYTFDFNENGWQVPDLSNAKFLGTKEESLGSYIKYKSEGYRLPEGRIVAKYEYKGEIISWVFNSFNGEKAFVISRLNPNGTLANGFYYKVDIPGKFADPVF
jgi:hypothetical protein